MITLGESPHLVLHGAVTVNAHTVYDENHMPGGSKAHTRHSQQVWSVRAEPITCRSYIWCDRRRRSRGHGHASISRCMQQLQCLRQRDHSSHPAPTPVPVWFLHAQQKQPTQRLQAAAAAAAVAVTAAAATAAFTREQAGRHTRSALDWSSREVFHSTS